MQTTKSDKADRQQQSNTQQSQRSTAEAGTSVQDLRPAAIQMQHLRQLAETSPKALQMKQLQQLGESSPQVRQLKELQQLGQNSPPAMLMKNLQTGDRSLVQRKESGQAQKPSGSAGFQEIATTMGQEHGVDTSALQAKHNSPFPGSLNAAATIQGNNIDFTPGQDTESNMKHEVAHYIINTKRGTPPKADASVNGQAINTTDEAQADRMAAMPVQRKAASAESGPMAKSTGQAGSLLQLKIKHGLDFSINHLVGNDQYTDQEAALKAFTRNKKNTIVKSSELTDDKFDSGTNKAKSDVNYDFSKELTVPSISAQSSGANKWKLEKSKKIQLEGYKDGRDDRITHLEKVSDPDGAAVEINLNFNNPKQLAQAAVAQILQKITTDKGFTDPYSIPLDEEAIEKVRTEINKFPRDIRGYNTDPLLTGAGNKAVNLGLIALQLREMVDEYYFRLERHLDATANNIERGWEFLDDPDLDKDDFTKEVMQDEYDSLWDETAFEDFGDVIIAYSQQGSRIGSADDVNNAMTTLKEKIEWAKKVFDSLSDEKDEVHDVE
ncbi:MAG: hypothetical protein WBB45_05200 [Cyclobacteriaceae bacterium]